MISPTFILARSDTAQVRRLLRPVLCGDECETRRRGLPDGRDRDRT